MDGEEYSLTHSSASDDEVCFYWASWSIILEWRLYWKHKHYLLNYLLNHMVTSSIIPQNGIQKKWNSKFLRQKFFWWLQVLDWFEFRQLKFNFRRELGQWKILNVDVFENSSFTLLHTVLPWVHSIYSTTIKIRKDCYSNSAYTILHRLCCIVHWIAMDFNMVTILCAHDDLRILMWQLKKSAFK